MPSSTVASRWMVLIGLVSLSFLALVVRHRSQSSQESRDSQKENGTNSNPKIEPAREIKYGEPVDLLDLIDADQDSIVGRWGFREGALISSGEPWARLSLPVDPPPEYKLSLTVTRLSGSNSLNLGLSMARSQGLLVIDGWDAGEWSGLELIDQKPFFRNETAHRGALLPTGIPVEILCVVRHSRVHTQIGGKLAVAWAGDFDRISLNSRWQVPRKQSIFIGSWESVFRIEALRLTPIVSESSSALKGR